MRLDVCEGLIGLDVMYIDFADDMFQRLCIACVGQKQFLGVTQLLKDRLGAMLVPLDVNSLVHFVHIHDLAEPDPNLNDKVARTCDMLYQK